MGGTIAAPRAPYAADPHASRGRLHPEPPSGRRTAFERDRDRIIHCTAFRRLKDKTQVFLTDEGDHYRTRLTHTIEVAQIARSIARALRLDEDLTEAIALAHDLGHPPFGHAGERALAVAMAAEGGFDHNAQSLRVVTRLERRYPTFDGLNLTWELLEGLAKHNGPLTDAAGVPLTGRTLPEVFETAAATDLWLWSQPSAEAQAAAIADDIAYDAHDIDDGLRAGLLTLDGLRQAALPDRLLHQIDRDYPGLEHPRRVNELIRRLIGCLIEDVIGHAGAQLSALGAAAPDDVRRAGRIVVTFSAETAAAERQIKDLLAARVYRHPRVCGAMDRAEAIVRQLYDRYHSDGDALPADWRAGFSPGEPARWARRIGDFMAGMTDRFAIAEYRRLFDRLPDFG